MSYRLCVMSYGLTSHYSPLTTHLSPLTSHNSPLTAIFPDMDLITYVTDRLGHDDRYAIDSTKLQKELGWEPSLQFEEGIEKTVKWYLENQEWLDNVTSGDYQKYYENMY